MIEDQIRKIIQEIYAERENKEENFAKENIVCIDFSLEDKKRLTPFEEKYNFIFDTSIENDLNFSQVWISSISHQDLALTSLGLDTSIGPLIEYIAQGKKVYVFPEGRKYLKYVNTASDILKNMWKNYENTLIQMGVIFENPMSNLDVEKGIDFKISKRNSNYTFVDKKLITVDDIKDLGEDVKGICIASNTIITPLAKDYMREKKIECILDIALED